MRKAENSVEDAKLEVSKLLGREVAVKYNRGRNKISTFRGTISAAHSNVFTITVHNEIFDRLSCSYIDMVCGEVSFSEI